MTLIGIILCGLLAAVTIIYVFFEEIVDVGQARDRITVLREKRDQILENLRDLHFEYRAGKLSEADYLRTRQALEVEAAALFAELEKAQAESGVGVGSAESHAEAPRP
jgi:DNA-binding FadR family transcriptional regulator